MPSSRGSPQPGEQRQSLPALAGGFFTTSAIWEAQRERRSPLLGKLQEKQRWNVSFNSEFTTYKVFIYAIQTFSQLFFTEFHTAIDQKSRILQHQNNIFVVQIANQKEEEDCFIIEGKARVASHSTQQPQGSASVWGHSQPSGRALVLTCIYFKRKTKC